MVTFTTFRLTGYVCERHAQLMQPESFPESPDHDRQLRRLRLLVALADARATRARRRSLRTAQIRELVALRRRLGD